jgi:hypothetical protein
MNDDAKFEDCLRRQPLKPIPGEWRAEILRRAAQEVDGRGKISPGVVSWFGEFKAGLRTVFAPAPRAWAGLAVVWAVILVLNLSGGSETATAALTQPVSVAQTRMALKQKQMLLLELAGRTETQEAIPRRAISPGPRSQRREESGIA